MLNAVKLIKEVCTKFKLNEHQMGSLVDQANALTDESRLEFLRVLSECETKDDVIERLIVPFNLRRMNTSIRDKVAAGEHMCMSVGPGENNSSPGYAYSIGLSVVSNLKAEIVVAGHTTCSNVIINEVHGILLNNQFAIGVHELKSTTPGRIRISKIQDVELFTIKHFANIDQWLDANPTKLYLVELSDKNNVLPGEYGYDGNYLQLKFL